MYRIIALKDFADVKKGDIGGFIKSENNLSQEGNCWIYDNAEIYGHAYVGDNAEVVGFSLIGGYTRCLKNNIYNNIKLAEEKNEDEEVQLEEINKILMKEFGKTVDDFLEEINDSLGTHDNTKEKFLSTMAALTSLNKLIK